MHSIFGIDPADVLHISAKTGEGINAILQAIVERIPPPSGEVTRSLKAILFDSSLVVFLFFILADFLYILLKIRQVPRGGFSRQHPGWGVA
jgi:translation elongation factor EF-4